MLKYRFWWTWDHSMDWAPDEPGVVPSGCDDLYKKRPQAFLKDYKLAVDYACEHGVNAIIVWGFLRRSHGGERASQELCRYAKDKGVDIWPGIGTSCYGGFYYKSDHLFNTETWLKTHPELRLIGKDRKPQPFLCHSKEENKEWLRKGTRWLYENFEVGGLNVEHGDYLICHCRDCVKNRGNIESGYPEEPEYYKDMALSIAPVVETALEIAPKSRVTYATYTGFNMKMAKNPPSFVNKLPEEAICQWTVTYMMDEEWSSELRPPTKHSIGYSHWGSQWCADSRNSLMLNHIFLLCQRANQARLEGVGIQGEASPNKVPNELNYLSLEYFASHNNVSLEDFAEDLLKDFFGRKAPASCLLEYLRMNNVASMKKTLKEIREIQTHQIDQKVNERWQWLRDEITRRYFVA